MFERQLGLRENPFLSGHQPKYVYPSREHQEALAHLRYGIQNREPFVLITGEVGTGKTTAVYDALAEWGARAVVALITNSALTRSELLEEICLRFGVAAPAPMSKPQTLVQLERLLSAVRARGELAILLLDEAQNLDRDLLEEIRLLSNLEVQGEKLLQIFLVGQPELEAKLAQAELRQLRQRIAIHYRISPLSVTETAHYIHHRVAVAGGNANELFPTDTCVEIFRVTNGIPREINIVAGQSLLNAFVEDARIVTAEHVKGVEKEIEFQSVLAQSRPGAVAPRGQVLPPVEAPPAPVERFRAPEPEPPMRTPEVPPTRIAPPPQPVRESQPPPLRIVPQPAPPAGPPPLHEPAPVARSAEPAPESPEDAPVLPAWFDEVMARQKTADDRVRRTPVVEPEAEPTAAPEPQRPMYERQSPVYESQIPVYESQIPAYEPPRYTAEPVPSAEPEIPRHEPRTPVARVSAEPPRQPRAESIVPLAPGEESYERAASIDFISPRLRAKLAEQAQRETIAEDVEEPRSGRGMPWLIVAAVFVVLAIASVMVMRFGPWGRAKAPVPTTQPVQQTVAPPASEPPSAPPPNAVSGTPATGKPAVAERTPDQRQPATVTKTTPARPATPTTATSAGAQAPAKPAATAPRQVATATPTSRPPAPSASAPAPAVAPPVAPKPAAAGNRFGIAVGTYLNEERANSERSSLVQSTQLPARIVTVAEDSVSMYRVVMGAFSDRVSAERAASDLIRRGLVNEARVIPIAGGTPN